MAKRRVSKRPEQRRAELIAAARRLFDEDGVDKTRVSDIVKSIGVAQGVFYYYFSSKNDIIEAVEDEVIAELETGVGEILSRPGTGLCQQLAGLMELYFGLIDQFTGDATPALPDLGAGPEGGGAPVQRGRKLLMGHILRLVAGAAEAGALPLPYPGWTVRVLEAGLYRVAAEALPPRAVIYALAEQALGLAPGCLAGCAPARRKKRGIPGPPHAPSG